MTENGCHAGKRDESRGFSRQLCSRQVYVEVMLTIDVTCSPTWHGCAYKRHSPRWDFESVACCEELRR